MTLGLYLVAAAASRSTNRNVSIHTDFERGFVRAQTIAHEDVIAHGGEVGARDAGKARDEGRDYVVKDGDMMLFKINI